MQKTGQEEKWAGDFGDKYFERNPKNAEEMDSLAISDYGFTKTSLNKEFLGGLDRSLRILEAGCNCGNQLMLLQKMGFKNLYGLEINEKTAEVAKKANPTFNLTVGSALQIPFKDNSFDMVFTSGVLIHIAPENIKKAMEEIYRCSKKYIWGFESYNKDYIQVFYRGNENLCWKADFAKMYEDSFKDLKLIKEKRVKYLDNDNMNTMFFFEKNA